MFILLIFLSVNAQKNSNLSKACNYRENNPKNQKFKNVISNQEIPWNPIKSLIGAKKIGGGTFGKVYLVINPGSFGTNKSIAIKIITPDEEFPMSLLSLEVKVAMLMNSGQSTPKFYGCLYDYSKRKQEYVYIVQEVFSSHLLEASFRLYIKKQNRLKRLELLLNLFTGLKQMWDLEYVHNDIKPHNMMWNKENDSLVLIDFGLVQLKTEKRNSNGSPLYMSPAKFNTKGDIQPIDDLYSLAVSISEIFSKKLDEAFSDPRNNPPTYLSNRCLSKAVDKSCQEGLKAAAIKILTEFFGNYQNSNEQERNPNFTTLIANLIGFHGVKTTYEEVIETIQVIIRDLKLVEEKQENLKKKREQEKEMRKKIERANKERELKLREELKRKQQQKEKEIEQQQKAERIAKQKQLEIKQQEETEKIAKQKKVEVEQQQKAEQIAKQKQLEIEQKKQEAHRLKQKQIFEAQKAQEKFEEEKVRIAKEEYKAYQLKENEKKKIEEQTAKQIPAKKDVDPREKLNSIFNQLMESFNEKNQNQIEKFSTTAQREFPAEANDFRQPQDDYQYQQQSIEQKQMETLKKEENNEQQKKRNIFVKRCECEKHWIIHNNHRRKRATRNRRRRRRKTNSKRNAKTTRKAI